MTSSTDMRGRRTKIVCTLGPSSNDSVVIQQLGEAGMDVARLNMSHGTHADHASVLAAIRAVSRKLNRPIAVLQDLCGPKIRTTKVKNGGVQLEDGAKIAIEAGRELGDAETIGTTLDSIAQDVQVGDRILLDDGLLELAVTGIRGQRVECEVRNGGVLKDRKGMNLPDTELGVEAVTEKDLVDLAWGLENGVDYVALSFVRRASDLHRVRERIRAAKLTGEVKLIAKIERPEAVVHMEEIVEEADGIMVARGDLGVELPVHEVPSIQKRLIRECILRDRPVITATQMLDSMMRNPRPTRAEVSDVANAIYDGTDAVMLSGETAAGKYPVEAVETMARVALEADVRLAESRPTHFKSRIDDSSFADAICNGAWRIAEDVNAGLLVCFTRSGRTALFMSKYFASVPVVGASSDDRALRRMALYRGVTPLPVDRCELLSELLDKTDAAILRHELAERGDVIVYVGGTQLTAGEAFTNMIKTRRLP